MLNLILRNQQWLQPHSSLKQKKTKNKNTLVYKTIVTIFSNVDENNEIKRFVYILFNGEP